MLMIFANHLIVFLKEFFEKLIFEKKSQQMTTNFFRKILSDCQTVWIQIRSNLLSGMVWIQTVCKGYQQTTLFLSLFQVGKQFELLNCDKHKSIAKKFKRDIATCRPDITHQVIYTVDFPEPDLGPDIGPFPIEK